MTNEPRVPTTMAPSGGAPGTAFQARLAIVMLDGILVAAILLAAPWRILGLMGFFRSQSFVFFAIAVFILRRHFVSHREAYRSAGLSPGRLSLHGIVTLAALCWWWVVATRGEDGAGGGREMLLGGLALALLWLVSALAVWLPSWRWVAPIAVGLLLPVACLWAAENAGRLTAPFWYVSSEPTIRMVQWLLAPLAGDAVIRPEPYVIGTRDFTVAISKECSGYQGIGLISVLLGGYLWWFRGIHRFPQSLLLFPLGIVLSYLANIVRITALLLVGIWISPEIAVDGFHSQAGWIMFLLLGTGLIYGARRSGFFTRRDMLDVAIVPATSTGSSDVIASAAACDTSAEHPPSAVACLVPFLVLHATGMLTAAFTSGFPVLYPLRVVAVAWALWRLRKRFPPLPETGLVSPGAIGIGFCTFALWMAIEHAGVSVDPKDVAALDPACLGEPWGTLWLLCRVVGYTIAVPIAEELAFRGFLMRRCIDDDVERVPVGAFTWPSFVASSLAFGLLHWPAWIAGTMAGVAFALALYQRRRLADAIAAHATTNALVSVWVIGTGTWNGWG